MQSSSLQRELCWENTYSRTRSFLHSTPKDPTRPFSHESWRTKELPTSFTRLFARKNHTFSNLGFYQKVKKEVVSIHRSQFTFFHVVCIHSSLDLDLTGCSVCNKSPSWLYNTYNRFHNLAQFCSNGRTTNQSTTGRCPSWADVVWLLHHSNGYVGTYSRTAEYVYTPTKHQ